MAVVSALGSGTTLTMYLPRIARLPEGILPAVAAAVSPVRADAIILVVEDEEGVREHTVEILGELGYTVLEAVDGEAALSVIEAHPEIDLLFTDVVLPGRFSGRELADEALRLRPELRILFTTGYARNIVLQDGRPNSSLDLISKPFLYQDLARKVQDVLVKIRA